MPRYQKRQKQRGQKLKGQTSKGPRLKARVCLSWDHQSYLSFLLSWFCSQSFLSREQLGVGPAKIEEPVQQQLQQPPITRKESLTAVKNHYTMTAAACTIVLRLTAGLGWGCAYIAQFGDAAEKVEHRWLRLRERHALDMSFFPITLIHTSGFHKMRYSSTTIHFSPEPQFAAAKEPFVATKPPQLSQLQTWGPNFWRVQRITWATNAPVTSLNKARTCTTWTLSEWKLSEGLGRARSKRTLTWQTQPMHWQRSGQSL